jgi:cell division protein FtsW
VTDRAGATREPTSSALRGLLQRPLTSYYLLLATVGLLVLIGLVMVGSATSLEDYAKTRNPYTSVLKQCLWALIGFGAFWVCQRLPVRTFRALSRLAMIVSFVLIITVDLLGLISLLRTPPGEELRTVQIGPIYADELWLHIGGTQLQPAELAKLSLVLWGAHVLTTKGRAVANWRELAMPLFPVSIALFLLVGFNDLGSMLCLMLIFIGMLWTAGVPMRIFGALGGAALAGVVALTLLPTKIGYRSARISVFLDPEHADSDASYQYFQGLYAIANGGWVGVGLGEGRMKWGRLPNGRNDFIFALIAEELGVVGCVVVLALFAVLAYTGFRIARRVADPYRRLVAAAITVWFLGQAMINIGGVVRLMPITGLPLPFISDGGTALVVALASVGILTSFARSESDAARALHARPPRRWARLLWAPLPPLPPTPRRGGKRFSNTGRSKC